MADPKDIQVNPDSPPAQPIDIQVTPDSAPAKPIDIQVIPDRGPFQPQDISILPDRAPFGPIDIGIIPDSPPGAARDILNIPDQGPRNPIDISIIPDLGPRNALDIPVIPDSQPASPQNIVNNLDSAPAQPININIPAQQQLRQPIDIPINYDLPAVDFRGAPSINSIIETVARFNRTVAVFLASISELDPITIDAPGAGALNPIALARWYKNYISSVGAGGVAKFIETQTILYSMNPVTARVFDPSYFLRSLLPGSMGITPAALDVQGGRTMETVAIARDKQLQLQSFEDAKENLYGPDTKYSDGQAFSVDTLVNDSIDATNGLVSNKFLKTEDGISKFDASSLFDHSKSTGISTVRAEARAKVASRSENISNTKLAQSAATNGIIRVGFPGENDGDDGSVLSDTQDPSGVSGIDDDDARIPLSFTDLRQVPGKKFRSVYVRPLNLKISEAFAPEYSEQSTFGRVDPVIGYQRTTRTFNVSFDLYAFAPEDLEKMYNKMMWLKSLVYPLYGADSLIKSGPVVRMRVGDLAASNLGGVAGVIRSLNFDFADAMWELRKGMKVPMSFSVQIDFTVLHDGPVGTMNGQFGVFSLPPGGANADRNTNYGDNVNDSVTDTSRGATYMPGQFMKFGESRRK